MAAAHQARPWYAASVPERPPQPLLEGEARADVGIVGAGFTGLSAALELARAGLRVVLLEADRVGAGASGRNGGQVLPGYGCGEARLLALASPAQARLLFDWSREGIALIHARRQAHAIACDWRDGHATVALKPRQVTELLDWQRLLQDRFDYPVEWWPQERLRAALASPRYLGGAFDPGAGHLHPLKYALGLADAAQAAGARLHEGSRVLRLERGPRPLLHTARGRLRCDHVVLAGNALGRGLAPELDARIMPVGSFVGATAPLGRERAAALIGNGMAVADCNWALDYFRLSADHRLLFGGRASYSNLPSPNLRAVMRRRMWRVFPQLQGMDFQYLWGGYIDISRNRAPDWGRLDPSVYYAQGFSGHGVAASNLAGKVLAEAILGQARRLDAYARLPHRRFPGGRLLRTPLLAAAMAWYKLRDALW